MPSKYILQQRGANGLENKAEVPALENGKIDMSWLPVVGESGAAIIARGSNANGEWVRWEDGTQVCWGILTGLSLTFSVYGTLFQATYNHTFPAQFANNNIAGSVSVVINTQAPWGNILDISTTRITLRAFDRDDRSTSTVDFRWLAIGRWK